MRSYLLYNHYDQIDAPYETPTLVGVFATDQLAISEVYDQHDARYGDNPEVTGDNYVIEEWIGTVCMSRTAIQMRQGIAWSNNLEVR